MTGNDIALILSRQGQIKLAEALDLSAAEVSRKLTDKPDHGWTLDQLALALNAVNARIVTQDDDTVTIKRDELTALNLLSKRYLDRRVNKDIAE